jgi:hypothetical protein
MLNTTSQGDLNVSDAYFLSLKRRTTKETTEEVVEVNAEGEAETLDEGVDTDEEAVDNLEDSVDGMVNLFEELGLDISEVKDKLGDRYVQ